MGEFQWLFELVLMVFVLIQIERVNANLREISHGLKELTEKAQVVSNQSRPNQ